jgi:small ligand-binding sensory domain FIST
VVFQMAYAASLSMLPDLAAALDELTSGLARQLGEQSPDLALLFVGGGHAGSLPTIQGHLAAKFPTTVLLTCTAESIAGGGREVEEEPALAVWGATLPGTRLQPFHAIFQNTPDGLVCHGLPEPPEEQSELRGILLLGDPVSCPIQELLERLELDYPGVPVLGGMASAWQNPRDPKLGLNASAVPRGAVGVVLQGGPRVRTVVSQGCRPIGDTMVVTKAEGNLILELGGRGALPRLEQTYSGLSEPDRALLRNGLHLGIAMTEYREQFARGDFLITNVISADRETGALAIGNLVRPGQTVQFHVRDSQTAHQDLQELLTRLQADRPPGGGALLFSCNGRGSRLFSQPNHDAGLVQEICGPLPLAGFFARGELGPVGKRNFIHGFTASLALFDEV